MTNIEQSGSRNRRRHMGSGLAGIRPDAINLGKVDHTANITRPYSVLNQLATIPDRMVRTEVHQASANRTKNKWVSH